MPTYETCKNNTQRYESGHYGLVSKLKVLFLVTLPNIYPILWPARPENYKLLPKGASVDDGCPASDPPELKLTRLRSNQHTPQVSPYTKLRQRAEIIDIWPGGW